MQFSPETLLKSLYDTLPDPVLVVDAARTVVAANSAAIEKFGYTEQQFVGKIATSLYASPADASAMGAALYPLNKEMSPVHRRVSMKRSDGSVFPGELAVSRLDTPDGTPIGTVAVIRDLTEVYRAQEERLRAETILKTALASISEGFVVYDAEDRLMLCNEAYRKIYAISAPAMTIGATFETIIRYGLEHGQFLDAGETEEEREAWIRERLRRHNNPGEPFVQEIPGRSLLVEERITDDNLRVGVRTDVSVLSKTKSQAERLGHIIESVTQEVYLLSLDGLQILNANRSVRQNLDYSLEELRQLSLFDLNSGMSRDDMREIVDPVIAGHVKVRVFDTRCRRKDGSTYACRVQLENMGELTEPAAVAFVEDITDRLKIERALKQKELEFQTLVRNIPDFITRARPDSTLTYVNEHYARYVGLPPEEMIGRKFLDFVSDDYREVLRTNLNGLTPERPMMTREQEMPGHTGQEFWCLWSNLMVFEDGEPVELVSVGRDITEMREAQTRIASQSRALELRNAALEQFSGIVSHDLKAPLRQIRLFAEMIAEDISAGRTEDLATYSNYISERSQSMEQMTSSLLEYSQLAYQKVNPEKFHLPTAVTVAWNNLSVEVAESGAELICDTDITVRADMNLLIQLFQNLFANSLKYRRPDEPAVIRVQAETGRDEVTIAVVDNGIGIDPGHAERIFGVFQRLYSDQKLYSGTGIGLALCRRIAESHDGSIVLDTSYEDGARFVLTLPRRVPG